MNLDDNDLNLMRLRDVYGEPGGQEADLCRRLGALRRWECDESRHLDALKVFS
ncbi:MAG: hypothetical protein RXP86_07520 [Acidilobus sp.]